MRRNKRAVTAVGRTAAEHNILLLFRPHPVQDLSVFHKEELPHIRIADDVFLASMECTLYELLAQTDALITDYSSVYLTIF